MTTVENSSPILKLEPHLKKSKLSEEAQFKDLYFKYQALVRSVLYKMGVKTNLDDLCQDVFVKVWRNLHKFEGRSQLKQWISKIAVNTAVDYFRKNKLKTISHEKLNLAQAPSSNRSEKQDLILKGLANLNLQQREVLVLVSLEGFSLGEASQMLEIPEGTAKSRLFYAKKSMQEFLIKEGQLS